MKNIVLILQREYLTRVRKKSFIIMTILGPLLVGAFSLASGWLASRAVDLKQVEILDESGLFQNKFERAANRSSLEVIYTYLTGNIETAKQQLKKTGNDALVYIPKEIMQNPKGVKIFSKKGVSLDLQMKIERTIEKEIETIKLSQAGITQKVLEDAKMNINSETINLSDGGEKSSSSGAATIIGMLGAFLIYISVFVYGTQVMRGVMEEKTSRIVEIIISSVKPFELMMGKILGIAMVGLTQFLLWIVLSAAVFTATQTFTAGKETTTIQQAQMQNLPPEMKEKIEKQAKQNVISETIKAFNTLPIGTILLSFIFYFLGGYLLYSALFGAVGSAVDSETDTQQFMLPITIPIIFSFVIAQFVIRDPNGSLAFWTSMIPFTSPIIMMVRIPFGVPIWQLALSMTLLVAGFLFTTWLAARIYRVGILMYGKKVSFKELGKWIFYKG